MKHYIYNFCKLVNFPSSVGMVPLSWLFEKCLFYITNWQNQESNKNKKIFYNSDKLLRFPNSVEIVPMIFFEEKYLLTMNWYLFTENVSQ